MGLCLTQQGKTPFIRKISIVITIVQLEQHKQTNTNSNTLANPQIVLNHNFKKNNHVSAAIRAMAGPRLDHRAKTQSGLSRHKGNGGSVF